MAVALFVRGIPEQGRGPIDDIGLDAGIIARLGSPGHARHRRIDLQMALFAPMDQIGGFPDLQILAAVVGGMAPAGPAHRQVGGEQEETISLRRAQDERIAQAACAHRRFQDRPGVVQIPPLQGVVAVRHGKAQLLALYAVAGEVDEQIGDHGRRRGCGFTGRISESGARLALVNCRTV